MTTEPTEVDAEYKKKLMNELHTHYRYGRIADHPEAYTEKFKESIKDDPHLAYFYATRVVKKRWPPGEPAILTNAMVAVCYARAFMPGRWPEAEELITKDEWAILDYARQVMKKRWPESEAFLYEGGVFAWEAYCNHFHLNPNRDPREYPINDPI